MPSLKLEQALYRQGATLVAGVDEAGRGPLAGPVVAAAVVLPLGYAVPDWLDDSKKLTAAQRERAFLAIRNQALCWRAVAAGPERIDRMNILRATLWAMARAVERLPLSPDWVLVDGNQPPPLAADARTQARPQVQTVVRGDSISASIAAASIVAKVARDRLMKVYGGRYPGYGFEGHMGYPTQAHRQALLDLGPCPIHRRSFKGVAS